jgi:hypothetical protein
VSLIKKAKKHLADNSMSYGEHFAFAFRHGLRCLKAGGMLITHSVMPCFFRRAGSRLVHELSKDFTEHFLAK